MVLIHFSLPTQNTCHRWKVMQNIIRWCADGHGYASLGSHILIGSLQTFCFSSMQISIMTSWASTTKDSCWLPYSANTAWKNKEKRHVFLKQSEWTHLSADVLECRRPSPLLSTTGLFTPSSTHLACVETCRWHSCFWMWHPVFAFLSLWWRVFFFFLSFNWNAPFSAYGQLRIHSSYWCNNQLAERPRLWPCLTCRSAEQKPLLTRQWSGTDCFCSDCKNSTLVLVGIFHSLWPTLFHKWI